jgi:hypothetical protein
VKEPSLPSCEVTAAAIGNAATPTDAAALVATDRAAVRDAERRRIKRELVVWLETLNEILDEAD